MRKILFIFVVVAAFVLGAGGGWYWWNVLRLLQSTDDGYVPSDVSVISPKVEGFIKKVKVTDNRKWQKALSCSSSRTAILGQGCLGGGGRGDQRSVGREL